MRVGILQQDEKKKTGLDKKHIMVRTGEMTDFITALTNSLKRLASADAIKKNSERRKVYGETFESVIPMASNSDGFRNRINEVYYPSVSVQVSYFNKKKKEIKVLHIYFI